MTADVAVKKDSQSPTVLEEQTGVERNIVPRKITSKPVRTVNCGTVSRRYQASFNLTGLEKDTA